MTDKTWLQAAKERAEAATEAMAVAPEWEDDGDYSWCPWCGEIYGGHADDCGREAWLGRLNAGGDE